MRILVVDDEPTIHLTCERALSAPGRQWCFASSAREACDVIAADPLIGVSIVDKNLPDGSGIDVIRELRRRSRGHQAIMLTGNPSMESAVAAFRAGACDFLEKPFDVALLEGRLTAAISEVESHRARERSALHAKRLEAMGLLAAGVAHEINTPLTVVVAGLEHIDSELSGPGDLSPEQLKELQSAAQDAQLGAERIRRIVRALRTFSARDRAPGNDVVSVNETIEAALTLVQNQLRHRARIACHLADVPPAVGDEQRLCQVLINLLLNAAQAVSSGHDGAAMNSIRVNTSATRDHVMVEVLDNGCGIRSEHLGRVFDPFFTTKAATEGTGLGLALSRQMIESRGVNFHREPVGPRYAGSDRARSLRGKYRDGVRGTGETGTRDQACVARALGGAVRGAGARLGGGRRAGGGILDEAPLEGP